MLAAAALMMILVVILMAVRNTDVVDARKNQGFKKITSYTCTEKIAPDAPVGVIKEYRFKAAEDPESDTCLAFYIVHQYARVYIDGQLVYSLMPAEESNICRIKTTGSNWVMVPLYHEDKGREIIVEITPVYESFRNREIEFLTGSQLAIYLHRMSLDTPQMILSTAAIIAGIAFLVIAVYILIKKKHGGSLAALGLFSVMTGLWRITDTRLTPLLMPGKTVLTYYISILMLMLGMVPLIKSIQSRFNRKSRICLELCCILSETVCIVQLLLQFFGILDLREMLFVTHIVIIIGAVIIFANIIYDRFWLKNKKKKYAGTKFSLICIAGVISDVIAFYIKGNSSGLIFTLSAFLIYVVLTGVSIMINYAEQEKYLRQQEVQLANSRISIMLSQIQPHFIFNSLNTIYYLCEKDTASAQKAISDFSDYLRGNIDSLRNSATIPFSNELKHIEIYLSLEKMRFDDDLNIVYDIQAKNFMIPSLTLQPIVENAVKHGISKADSAGTVVISSRELENCFEISVTDDGIGFDTAQSKDDGRTHIGIENVRQRLEMISGASLDIRSSPGNGTKAVVRIPKEDSDNEDTGS